MGKEMDKMYELLKDDKKRRDFMKIVESLKNFPSYFANLYLSDIKALDIQYNLSKVDKYGNNCIFIEFALSSVTYAVDIKFYDGFKYDVSITSRGGNKETKDNDVKHLKQQYAASWPFGIDKVPSDRTNRYRTELKDPFNKSELLQTVENILTSFDLKKTNE